VILFFILHSEFFILSSAAASFTGNLLCFSPRQSAKNREVNLELRIE
jgi:hypothetical protein